MKPIFEDISANLLHSSFYAYSYKTPAYDFKWHFHPEYELTYIVKGNGYRLIGNSHQEFNNDDFVLIGPNLPHTWFGKAPDTTYFEAIVIQLPFDFVQKIIDFKEAKHLKNLFEKAHCGLSFREFPLDTKALLQNIIAAEGIEKMTALLGFLSKLTTYSSSAISSAIYKYQINEEMKNRINTVCVYLQNNYTHKMSLKMVADLICMTESNFCKFFKKATGITFSNYLNELRISAACKLLLNTDQNINTIAYNCGYESLSYFNRIFLEKKQQSPKAFRNNHSSK